MDKELGKIRKKYTSDKAMTGAGGERPAGAGERGAACPPPACSPAHTFI